MEQQILWRSSTTEHDWRNGPFLPALLDQATRLGLIGPVTWQKAGIKGHREKVNLTTAGALLAHLPQPQAGEPPTSVLEAGGESPRPWTVKLSVALLDEKTGQPQNVSMAWLFFDAHWADESSAQSHALRQTFLELHDPQNTDYAFIHPYQHWMDFSERYYKRALTTGSMFRGVFWANFLGPGQLERFDPAKLASLPAYETRWLEQQGLFVIATPDIRDVVEPSGEKELVRLTEEFRQALRPVSRS